MQSVAHILAAALRPAGSFAGKSARNYWLTGIGFILIYCIVERGTLLYELDGLGITLWSPSAGLSLTLLLIGGPQFAPFVFVASLITEAFTYSGPRWLIAMLGTSLVLAVGFSLIAVAIERPSKARAYHDSLAGTLALLILVPVGALVIAFAFCGVLYASGVLPGWRFLVAVRNHWIGNTVGMVTLAPAIPALLERGWSLRRLSRAQALRTVGFLIALAAALAVIFEVDTTNEYQFFYMLFLPVIWVAIQYGHTGAAIALLITHLALVTTATRLGYAAFDFISFQMLMLVLSATGLVLGIIVTERRRSEEKLRAQQGELARAVRQATVGALGTALAHEISQPMASAANYLHAARRLLRASESANAPVAEALAKAESESRRARAALEQVRDYVSSGRIEPRKVDMTAIARKIAGLVDKDSRERGVVVGVSAAQPLLRVWADPIQVELLLANLVTNAIDSAAAGPAGDGWVTIRLYQSADRFALEVSDNGPGVAADIADRIFEPFESTKTSGMGLGLTVVRQILESHGGSLSWAPREPHGASFTATFPIDGRS
jgi:signal transduction histidine kinase